MDDENRHWIYWDGEAVHSKSYSSILSCEIPKIKNFQPNLKLKLISIHWANTTENYQEFIDFPYLIKGIFELLQRKIKIYGNVFVYQDFMLKQAL